MYFNIFFVFLATLIEASANDNYERLFNSLEDLKVKLNVALKQMDKRLEKLESGGGGMPKAPQRTYGFTVQRNIRILSAPPETTIEFDRVVTNHGGMWDRTSNMFISPVKGLYMFYLYVFRSNTGVYLDAYIVKDGVKLAVAHISNAYPHGDSSVSLVVELEPLDRVYCRLSQGILLSHVGSSIGHVHFSGFLISVIP